ncbi:MULTISPECIES: N-formylglutamate amidohydrolase [Legionella]|uniref:N-formylglutamate amidohydrolase n=1 Tax=Legionella septentrionalis TaxID=2498109 RepID=A0A3S0VAG3_9GAMM|nr:MULTISPECIES: N-formylglutamate amidohydrolase [Legionella]MCP0913859.1 N-formylglutamate amidohydrolase [Legionella sp. 27cVA30]RUQ85273.1 N-formylglutamate amidohydrolase [Legionella septentrionalis]RUQ98703.1 N-formylglutamate amidohydrolase [Legionella septentrionalis]RUR09925.1 N-formylglutamate amidohydrolase [Legionella septentrionalis]RUR14996.1 N-formylglutamate amidohydrolase [Legionella septentrionalis]
MKPTILVISCEHGGNDVPPQYALLFKDNAEILATHRAYDAGSLAIAEYLQQKFSCDFVYTTITRLLIDCNRSLNHPKCFSEFTKKLSRAEKQVLIDAYYLPYRRKLESLIQQHIALGHQVLHLSIHSFVPELKGVIRNAAISLLYDYQRHAEKEVARIWRGLLLEQTPAYRIRMNYPYRGDSDGFTSALRKQYSEKEYLGIEVESNQALIDHEYLFSQLLHVLSASLKDLLQVL